MIQLNRSMMERYEIENRRPQTLRAAIFGADRMMLGVAARLLDKANEGGADIGAVCITRAAQALNAQDGMFTMLVRGDRDDGGHSCEERVVQSILRALNPETEFEAMLDAAAEPELEMLFLPAECGAVEMALAARFMYARWEKGLAAPAVLAVGDHVLPGCGDELRRALASLAQEWKNAAEFSAWLKGSSFCALLAQSLCGPLNEAECAKARHDMNYRDDFIAWAEPQLKCTPEANVPERLAAVCTGGDFSEACRRKQRLFDAVVFLCTAVGYLSGKDSFAQVLKDEKLRDWIGHAFFDEILPELPYAREEIAPHVISAFSRLENSMNDMPLMEVGRALIFNCTRTVLPAIRAHADREFESPRRLSLALSAAIMLYAGARKNEKGVYEVARGESSAQIYDDPAILEAFSRLSHDMPAETLAYAALADRDIWGSDLREIDGLEMRTAFNLSSIQRVGLRETLRLQEEA